MLNMNISCEFPLLRFERPWVLERFDGSVDMARQAVYDELLLERVISGENGPTLCIKNSGQCLVATVRESRMPGFEAARKVLAAQGWPVIVRCTGGSCVPLGPGVLSFSVIHPKVCRWHLEDGYRLLCNLLSRLLASYGLATTIGEVPGSFCDGRYNLQAGGKKLVGTAQRWAGGSREQAAVLAHACLLVDVNLAEATEKINTLYRLCGQAQQFDPEACTTVRDCLRGSDLSPEEFVRDVEQRLAALVSHYFEMPS